MWGKAGGRRIHKTRDDPWMSTVTNVSGFLAGFSLASVVVIAGGPGVFRWPGWAVLALTIASMVLIVAAQESRQGAYYYEKSTKEGALRYMGPVSRGHRCAAGRPGRGWGPAGGAGVQVSLRWVAMWGAFLAAFAEVLFMTPSAARVIKRLAVRVPGYLGTLRGRH